jgi:hypothetical protein
MLRYSGEDTTRYKNVHIWDTAPVRLFNLVDDPDGNDDLASSYPEVVERLKKRIENWHAVDSRLRESLSDR